MSDFHQRAIEDVADAVKLTARRVERCCEGDTTSLDEDAREAVAYAVAQREGVLELEAERESKMDTHKLGTCLRFANGETCIGCGDEENGQPPSEKAKP